MPEVHETQEVQRENQNLLHHYQDAYELSPRNSEGHSELMYKRVVNKIKIWQVNLKTFKPKISKIYKPIYETMHQLV